MTNPKLKILTVALLAVSTNSFANPTESQLDQQTVVQIIEDDKLSEPDFSKQTISEQTINENKSNSDVATQDVLPSELNKNTDTRMSKEETLAYLQKNPQELEILFAKLIRIRDLEGITDLLPLYQKYPQRDPSLIEWGQAILQDAKGETKQAISIFRKLTSEFPKVRTLRFHFALALLNDKQFNSAKLELEKVRSDEKLPEADLAVVNRLVELIDGRDDWSFYSNFTYLDDDNLTNSPKEGTKYGNGFVAGARESGKGIGFSLSANKRWLYDNKLFTSFNADTYGNYYWDNKNYNIVSLNTGVGLGYQNKDKEFELIPYYTKQYYGKGSNGNGKLHDYRNTLGVKLHSKFVLDNKLKYHNSIGYAQNDYVEGFENNDSSDFTLDHTLMYHMNPLTYLYGGVDYFNRDSKLKYNSFVRQGIRLGWGQTWPKGFSTRTNIGYGLRNYEAMDFFGDRRKNNEYNAGISLWNRKVHLFGLTPKINWRYSKVESNSAREEVESNDVSFNLTKSF